MRRNRQGLKTRLRNREGKEEGTQSSANSWRDWDNCEEEEGAWQEWKDDRTKVLPDRTKALPPWKSNAKMVSSSQGLRPHTVYDESMSKKKWNVWKAETKAEDEEPLDSFSASRIDWPVGSTDSGGSSSSSSVRPSKVAAVSEMERSNKPTTAAIATPNTAAVKIAPWQSEPHSKRRRPTQNERRTVLEDDLMESINEELESQLENLRSQLLYSEEEPDDHDRAKHSQAEAVGEESAASPDRDSLVMGFLRKLGLHEKIALKIFKPLAADALAYFLCYFEAQAIGRKQSLCVSGCVTVVKRMVRDAEANGTEVPWEKKVSRYGQRAADRYVRLRDLLEAMPLDDAVGDADGDDNDDAVANQSAAADARMLRHRADQLQGGNVSVWSLLGAGEAGSEEEEIPEEEEFPEDNMQRLEPEVEMRDEGEGEGKVLKRPRSPRLQPPRSEAKRPRGSVATMQIADLATEVISKADNLRSGEGEGEGEGKGEVEGEGEGDGEGGLEEAEVMAQAKAEAAYQPEEAEEAKRNHRRRRQRPPLPAFFPPKDRFNIFAGKQRGAGQATSDPSQKDFVEDVVHQPPHSSEVEQSQPVPETPYESTDPWLLLGHADAEQQLQETAGCESEPGQEVFEEASARDLKETGEWDCPACSESQPPECNFCGTCGTARPTLESPPGIQKSTEPEQEEAPSKDNGNDSQEVSGIAPKEGQDSSEAQLDETTCKLELDSSDEEWGGWTKKGLEAPQGQALGTDQLEAFRDKWKLGPQAYTVILGMPLEVQQDLLSFFSPREQRDNYDEVAVEFAKRKCSTLALDRWQGGKLGGHKDEVLAPRPRRRSRSRQGSFGERGRNNAFWKLCMSCVPVEYGEATVKELFEAVGLPVSSIESMRFNYSLRRASGGEIMPDEGTQRVLVRIGDEKVAQSAWKLLQGQPVSNSKDKVFTLRLALQEVSAAPEVKILPSVYMSDIPVELDERALRKMHDALGLKNLRMVKFLNPRADITLETRTCFLRYDDEQSAEEAVRVLDGKEVITASGRDKRLGVSMAIAAAWQKRAGAEAETDSRSRLRDSRPAAMSSGWQKSSAAKQHAPPHVKLGSSSRSGWDWKQADEVSSASSAQVGQTPMTIWPRSEPEVDLKEKVGCLLEAAVVSWFQDKGFGFAKSPGGKSDIYLHRNNFLLSQGLAAKGLAAGLKQGDRIFFELGPKPDKKDTYVAFQIVGGSCEVSSAILSFGTTWGLGQAALSWIAGLPEELRSKTLEEFRPAGKEALSGQPFDPEAAPVVEDSERELCEWIRPQFQGKSVMSQLRQALGVADDEPMDGSSCSLRIKNFPQSESLQIVEDLLCQHGEVLEVKMSRGSNGLPEAVARMATLEQAKAALEALNGSIPDGLCFPLSVAFEADADGPSDRLFVSELASDATEEIVKQLFSPFGDVVSCTVFRESKTFPDQPDGRVSAVVCFKTFADARLAMSCLDGQATEGSDRPLSVNFKRKKLNLPYSEPTGGKLFVGRLPHAAEEHDLLAVFAKFGKVQQVQVPRNPNGIKRGFASVSFESPETLAKVLQEQDQHGLLVLGSLVVASKWGERAPEGNNQALSGAGRFPAQPAKPPPLSALQALQAKLKMEAEWDPDGLSQRSNVGVSPAASPPAPHVAPPALPQQGALFGAMFGAMSAASAASAQSSYLQMMQAQMMMQAQNTSFAPQGLYPGVAVGSVEAVRQYNVSMQGGQTAWMGAPAASYQAQQFAQQQTVQAQFAQPQVAQPQVGQPQVAQPKVTQPQVTQPVKPEPATVNARPKPSRASFLKQGGGVKAEEAMDGGQGHGLVDAQFT